MRSELRYLLAGLLVLAVAFVHSPAWTAPAPKDAPAVEGYLEWRHERAPVVVLPGQPDEPRKEFWLVFEDTKAGAEAETQVGKFEAGSRVRVFGRHGGGGQYRYVVVTGAAKVPE